MSITAPKSWIVTVAAIVALCAVMALGMGLSGMGLMLAGFVSMIIMSVPFSIGEVLFEKVEGLGRATGKTREAVGGGYIAETTTTKLGAWVAGLVSALLSSAFVLWVAIANGYLNVSW